MEMVNSLEVMKIHVCDDLRDINPVILLPCSEQSASCDRSSGFQFSTPRPFSTMYVTAGVSEAVVNIRDKLRDKIGQTKVKRYWHGKAPEWSDDAEEDGDVDVRTLPSVTLEKAFPVTLEKAFPAHEDSTVPHKDDRRLRRLSENRAENKEDVRTIRQAEILSIIEENPYIDSVDYRNLISLKHCGVIKEIRLLLYDWRDVMAACSMRISGRDVQMW